MTSMISPRHYLLTGLLLFLALPVLAQDDVHNLAPEATAREGFPEGWVARLDRTGASLDDVHFTEAPDGYRIITGPAGIFFRPEDQLSGTYKVEALIMQNKPSDHPEAYGLFVGGRHLDTSRQDYLYFLIRQTGEYLVKHRAGAETHTLVNWTKHEAINRPHGKGRALNTLAIWSEPDRVVFLVNGKEVTALKRVPMLNTDGIAGLRVNHNLDITVREYIIDR